jgi:FkbM family methyltransferase
LNGETNVYAECTGESALRLIDEGGRGGLQKKWLPYEKYVAAVLIEPAPDSAEHLRRIVAAGHRVIEAGLSNIDGPRGLFVTRNPVCSSLHEPNEEVLKHYGIWRPHFEVVGRQEVQCRRYDSLFLAGQAPAPEAIKIDTQGHEFEVLEGFGGLLVDCLGIELEAHFYPAYRSQKLFHQIVELLATYNFVLRRMEPADSFGGDLVEANVYFTKPRRIVERRSSLERLKHDFLCEVWCLDRYSR